MKPVIAYGRRDRISRDLEGVFTIVVLRAVAPDIQVLEDPIGFTYVKRDDASGRNQRFAKRVGANDDRTIDLARDSRL